MLMFKNSGVPLDVKDLSDDGTFEGYASTFGNVDDGGDIVEPGAFTQSLVDAKRAGRKIKLLWQHDTSQPIGIWTDMAEDSKGLWAKGRLLTDVSPRAAEAYGLLKAGALDGLSIGYRVVEAAPKEGRSGVRSLRKLNLKEVSIVTFQMNDRAKVESVKQIIAAGELPTEREFEDFLRDAGGFSKTLAVAIASKAKPHLRGEPDGQANDALQRFYDAMRGA